MKIISYAELTCDDCGHQVTRLAIPHTPDTPKTRRALTQALTRTAHRHGWSVEGPDLFAGDLCGPCLARLHGAQ